MANLRVTPAWQRANFSTQGTISCKVLSVFSPSLLYQPRGAGTFSVPPRHEAMRFMHRPTHYRLNIPGKNLSAVMRENFDTRQAEKKGASRS